MKTKFFFCSGLLVFCSAGLSQTNVCFDSSVTYLTSSGPASVIAADLNSDGKQDLALACRYGNEVASVLLNAGLGTFSTAVNYNTGNSLYPGPFSVTSADFNGDGKPDLVFANHSVDSIGMLLNAGVGTFAAPLCFTVGSYPSAVASADFNGDGKPDVAATTSANKIAILLNAGAGTFSAAVNYTVGIGPCSIVVADFNEDGNPDLAVTNSNSNSISVLLNAGGGVFNAAFEYGTGNSPRSVASDDFNGDNKRDLVVANLNDNTLSVLFNDGTGNFNSSADYPAGGIAGPIAVTAGDLNGDGASDLASVDYYPNGTVSILPNDGSGNFGAATSYEVGTYPYAVIGADLDGDSKLDLAVANLDSNSVSVLLQCSVADIESGVLSEKLLFYPNPVNSILKIELEVQGRFTKLEVLNQLGIVVITNEELKISGNKTQVNLGGLSPGIYFLRVCTSAGSLVKKIIKQ